MEAHDIQIILVEDDPEIRGLMTYLLNASPGFSCLASFADGESALEHIPNFTTDLILMDIQLPGVSGIEVVRQLKNQQLPIPVLMLTVQEDDESVFQSLCAGADGYLLKGSPPADLLNSITEAFHGGAPMSPAIARKVIRSFQIPKIPSSLSKRETEVLELLCEGETYRSIGDKLFVSGNTVKAHIKKIYGKLQVHTRAEAVKKALREGWV